MSKQPSNFDYSNNKYADQRAAFKNNLAYFIPPHGAPKQSLNIPQCHKLFVCPPSCGRRNAIRAFKNGEKQEMSFLFVTPSDIISGNYENIIGDGVQDVLDILPCQPKAFIIYVNCIDDFLGTDEAALLAGLQERFADLRFTLCHINPVADDAGVPRGMLMYDKLYGFLQQKTADAAAINLIGNYVPIDPKSEFHTVLQAFGISKINQLFAIDTFAEYENMANSRLNLVLMVMGSLAAERLEERLQTPWLFKPPSYDIRTIEQTYADIAQVLGKEPLNFDREIANLQATIARTVQKVGQTPILVDTSATMNPFALSRALLNYGFNVLAVFAAHAKETDKEDVEYLKAQHPQLKILNTLAYQEVLQSNFPAECLAIGFDSAYSVKAQHFVDIRHDEGFYGFYGVEKLMHLIETAYEQTTEWD